MPNNKLKQLNQLKKQVKLIETAIGAIKQMISDWAAALGEKKEVPFDFDAILKVMPQDKNRLIQIVALYWKYRGTRYENRDQYQPQLKRQLRAASNLKGYTDDRILETMDYLEENEDFKWGLESIFKFIDHDLDELASRKEKKNG